MSKFDSPITEWIYLENEWDEEVGDSSSGVGWAGMWKVREGIDGGVIIWEKVDGSVVKAEYRTDAELYTAWYEVEEALSMDGPEPEEGDWVVQDSPTGYVVSQSGRIVNFSGKGGIDPVLTWISAEMDYAKFWPNVWHCSDHGNYQQLDLYEMGIRHTP
jgi:hypothetical protein